MTTYEILSLTLLGMLLVVLWNIASSLRKDQNELGEEVSLKELLNQTQRLGIYLRFILIYAGIKDADLTEDKQERLQHALSTELECVGLDAEQVERVHEKQAEYWRFLHEDHFHHEDPK